MIQMLSSVAFDFNLRRYMVEVLNPATQELVCLVRPHLPTHIARHVMGANPTPETRVYNDMDDVASTATLRTQPPG